MKQVSIWASRHKWPARIMIVLLYILLNIIGIITGNLLQSTGIKPGIYFIDLMFIIILSGYLFYPKKATYYKRKFFDGIMLVSTFCIICFYGTQMNSSSFLIPFSSFSAATITINKPVSETPKIVPEKKLTKKEIRKQMRQVFKEKDTGEKGTKIILIALTILLAAGLLCLLLALSCSIACSGSEALAVLVLVLGTFGLVFSAIKIIQRINRGPKKKESPAL